MEFWERMKERREAMGWSPKEAAHQLDVTPQYIGQWEDPRNLKRPTFEKISKICEIYECSADWLLGRPNAPIPHARLSIDERSIITIMKKLPEYRREEVIRHAEVVLEMHRKIEEEESKPSLFQTVLERYVSGEDDTPRIIGNESDDSEDEQSNKT